MDQIRFGPAGNSESFYEEGFKHTWQAFEWIARMGLNAFEYPFGRGVRMKKETGEKIAEQALRYDVKISIHAPYYINLAGEGAEKHKKNLSYFLQCAEAARYLDAERVIFHPGACSGLDRDRAFKNVCSNLADINEQLSRNGFGDIVLCPETMGKKNQIADLQEVVILSSIASNIIPAVDFGHLHARTQGGLSTYDDFVSVIEYLYTNLDENKVKNMHVHFSRIEYTEAGEKMHRRFSDKEYGPDFDPLMRIFAERNMTPTVICESSGTQAQDACMMKQAYDYYIMKKG